MSAKLEQALANKKVFIKKGSTTSGEVVINFHNKNIKNVVISHNGVINLLSKRGVSVEAIRKSNLRQLILERKLTLI